MLLCGYKTLSFAFRPRDFDICKHRKKPVIETIVFFLVYYTKNNV